MTVINESFEDLEDGFASGGFVAHKPGDDSDLVAVAMTAPSCGAAVDPTPYTHDHTGRLTIQTPGGVTHPDFEG